MLHRLKISTKLAILVAIPLVSLILLGLIAAQTLQQVRIGGDAYGRIVQRKDLIADVQTPALHLVEANLLAHRLETALLDPSLAPEGGPVVPENAIDELEIAYNDRLANWQERLDPNDPITKQLFAQVDSSGQAFWRLYHDQFLPAFDTANASITSLGATATDEQLLALLDPATLELHDLNAAYEAHEEQIDQLVAMANSDLERQEQAADDLTREQAMLLGFAGLAIVALVAAAGSLMARSIGGPLRSLTAAVNEAATVGLPELVQTVRDLPVGAALPEPPPMQVRGGEEIKQLAASFESLRNNAMQLAAGESQLRQSVSSMFINLGRRNQNLLNRTLNFITTLEESERDPESLDNLFRLDHLVTRMRRNAESLLVLAGTEASRTWSQPVDVGDIVRGALSEIEAYDRINIPALEPVEVRGNVAADVSHMLAELLENATTFSPPSAAVTVIGKYAHDGYLLCVSDNGIGMTQKELREANLRLDQASKFDTSPMMVLGLFVVSRLALRHGIQVQLTESPAEGVTAKVKLPLALLEGADLADHLRPAENDEADATSTTSTAAGTSSDTATDLPVAAEPPAGLLALGTDVATAFGADADPSIDAPAAPSTAAPTPPRGPQAPRATAAAPDVAATPVPSTTAAQHAVEASAPTARAGLTRRSRGAQRPDTGPEAAALQPAAPTENRSPDQVRSALSAFQGGVEYGRTVDQPAEQSEPAQATQPAAVASPASVPAPATTEAVEATAAAPAAQPAKASLSRRVKGAHMFDTGPTSEEGPISPSRSAEDVRSALSRFQQGQHQAETDATAPDNGNQ